MIRTKILATMGPACSSVETLLKMFDAGVDVCRLNFSHGDLEQHGKILQLVREAAAQWGKPVAILGDLGGPKIRLGEVAEVDGAGGMPIAAGEDLIIQREPIVGRDGRVSTTYNKLVDDLQVGHRVLVEDGLLRFVCSEKSADAATCRCTVGGVLKSAKGINLPDTPVNLPSMTPKDWKCADWAVANDLDYLALSFVRKADDIKLLKGHLQYHSSDIHVIAKIEKPEALEQMDQIMEVSDGLMIARGDLGVEMDVALVPIIQKDLIRRCHKAGKPVIVATQMLQSMVNEATPTRAEVSDVANAIFDGTDAVMLSAETSVGKYPLLSVRTMAHVAKVSEEYLVGLPEVSEAPARRIADESPAAALARGAWRIVHDLQARLVAVWSQTGSTARVFSKLHFPVPIVVLSSDLRALRLMAIHYGVVPQEAHRPESMAELFSEVDRIIIGKNYAKRGDRIVLVAGWSPAMPTSMNGIIIHTVGQPWTPMSPTDLPLRPQAT